MPICTHCGAQSPDNARTCTNCGIAFGHQIRAKSDLARARTGQVVRLVTRIAIVIVLVIVGPSIYHVGRAAYLKHHLKSITDGANIECDGPITDSMQPYEVKKIQSCLAARTDLTEAQHDYEEFTKGDKH